MQSVGGSATAPTEKEAALTTLRPDAAAAPTQGLPVEEGLPRGAILASAYCKEQGAASRNLAARVSRQTRPWIKYSLKFNYHSMPANPLKK